MRVTAAYLERVAREYQAAFERANGKAAPDIVWENGWFMIGRERVRRKKLEDMRDVLRMRSVVSPAK